MDKFRIDLQLASSHILDLQVRVAALQNAVVNALFDGVFGFNEFQLEKLKEDVAWINDLLSTYVDKTGVLNES